MKTWSQWRLPIQIWRKSETDLIASFCGLIGIQQEQLDLVTSDASKRLKEQTPTVPCAKCSAQIQSGARFCPSCGAPVESAAPPSTALEFDIPKAGYAIAFSESTAPGFATAVELAKQMGPIQTVLKNKKNWYLVGISTDRFIDVTRMAKALAGIRNRAIYRDGQQIEWDEVFGFIWCANQRDHAYRPVEYCFGKDENRILSFSNTQTWRLFTSPDCSQCPSENQLDHSVQSMRACLQPHGLIRHDLATNLHRFRFCPYLSQEFIEAVVVSIAERVEITENGPWKYNSVYEETPGSIKVVEREGSGDFSYTREYYADGVRPRGLLPLKEILTRAFSISQVKPGISPLALLTK